MAENMTFENSALQVPVVHFFLPCLKQIVMSEVWDGKFDVCYS
jgi:hypothetical protein